MHIYINNNNKHLRIALILFSALLIFGCGANLNKSDSLSRRTLIINPDYTGGIYDHHNHQYILWGSDGVISRSSDGENWLQHSMNTADTLRDSAIHENYLLAVGDNNTILESYDAGSQWNSVDGEGGTSNYLTALVRRNGDKLIGGTNGQLMVQVAKSRQQGDATWQSLTLSPGTLHKLIERDGLIIASGDDGFLATSKNGFEWQTIQTNLSSSIFYLVASGEKIVALAANGNFLMSQDSGLTWQSFHTEVSAAFTSAAFSDDQTQVMIAAQNGQVIYANLRDNSWHESEVRLNDKAIGVSSLTYIPENNRFLAAGYSGLFAYTDDAGATWTSERLNGSFGAQLILFNPRLQQLVSFGTGGEIHISNALEYKWQSIQKNLVGYYRIAESFESGWLTLGKVGEVVTASHIKKISPRQKSLSSWTLHEIKYLEETTPPHYRSLVQLRNGDLLAAGPTGAIMKSSNNGIDWRTVLWTPFDNNDVFTQLVVNPYDRSVLAIEVNGRFYLSRDGGETWASRWIDIPLRVWQADVNPANGVVVAIGQQGQAVVYSPQKNDWTVIKIPESPDLYGCFYSAASRQFFLSGKDGTLIQGSENGENWQRVSINTSATLRNVGEASNGDLIGFGQQQTILRKSLGSQDWHVVHHSKGDEAGELRRMRVDPKTKEVFIVGSHGILLSSHDNGLSWEKVALHTKAGFRDMAIWDNTLLLAGEKLALIER